MNVMRHLRVPNKSVQDVIVLLKDSDMLNNGMRICPDSDGKHRLIPLSENAPNNLPSHFTEFEEVMHEGKTDERPNESWWKHLSEIIGEDTIKQYGESWPSNHEFIGDIMIVRINEEISSYKEEIAISKMTSHPKVRMVMEDRGVQGELRIRDLSPIALRQDSEIITGDLSEEMCDTRVLVRESGKSILCDPRRAYFSTKLHTERLETLRLAKELRSMLARPLRVCDPFCGVGPALAMLLGEKNLVGRMLASDLNPDAVELLLDNLRRWDRRDYPTEAKSISRLHEDRIVGIADATKLHEDPSISGAWDLLLVNLPHRTVELLPTLVPLLDRTGISMIRGRVITAESEIEDVNEAIRKALPSRLQGTPEPTLKIKRDYSSTLRLCSFEAWIDSMP